MGVYDSGHRKMSVVRIKRVNLRENIRAFGRDKRNCPLDTGVRIKWVSLEGLWEESATA